MSYILPLGPYHPALEEPVNVKLLTEGEIIKDSEVFPEMLASMVKIGEETGSLDGILEKTADFYDDELEQAIQTTVALVEPALIVVMGLVIGTIVLAIMIPMFTMYGNM